MTPQMLEYRVTKYNPAFRDSTGAYTRDEWTAVSDVGRSFGGIVLTREEYQRVENAYIAAAIEFLRESGVSSVLVVGLENHTGHVLDFDIGAVFGLDRAGEVLRRVLREDFWCRLEGPKGFVRVGWDYYMYVGVSGPCPKALALAERLGLFVEDSEAGQPAASIDEAES
jgi:hypothetical protein